MINRIGNKISMTTMDALGTVPLVSAVADTSSAMASVAGDGPRTNFSTSNSFAAKNPTTPTMAQSTKPTTVISPTSAFNIAAAATGPGCGGKATWTVSSTAPTGNAIFIGWILSTRAKPKTIGAKMIKATSKNTGMPKMKDAAVSAAITRPDPKVSLKRRARLSAPPETSISRPNIDPKPTTMATEPNTLPIPATITGTTFANGTPVANAVPMLTNSKDTKAGTSALMTRTSKTATAMSAMINNAVVPMVHPSPLRSSGGDVGPRRE